MLFDDPVGVLVCLHGCIRVLSRGRAPHHERHSRRALNLQLKRVILQVQASQGLHLCHGLTRHCGFCVCVPHKRSEALCHCLLDWGVEPTASDPVGVNDGFRAERRIELSINPDDSLAVLTEVIIGWLLSRLDTT